MARRTSVSSLTASRADTTAETTLNLRDPAADVLEGIWNEEWQKNLVHLDLFQARWPDSLPEVLRGAAARDIHRAAATTARAPAAGAVVGHQDRNRKMISRTIAA